MPPWRQALESLRISLSSLRVYHRADRHPYHLANQHFITVVPVDSALPWFIVWRDRNRPTVVTGVADDHIAIHRASQRFGVVQEGISVPVVRDDEQVLNQFFVKEGPLQIEKVVADRHAKSTRFSGIEQPAVRLSDKCPAPILLGC